MTGHLPRTRRSDAQDNRERILGAARAVFAADRHFPAKATLAHEVYTTPDARRGAVQGGR
jgi:hypothetical protein